MALISMLYSKRHRQNGAALLFYEGIGDPWKRERLENMKFIHLADVHLGCIPDGKASWAKERGRELWETFRSTLDDADKMGADLVLIAGDLFHRTPDETQLREVNYLMGSHPKLCFVLMAGNHDCNSPSSAWDDFEFARNVAFLGNTRCECVRFPALKTEVYGFSHDRNEITAARYDHIHPDHNDYIHILLAHGGDAMHIPINPAALERSGFDYIALGHIHKMSEPVPDLVVYPGALSPIDAGDEGAHGYIAGEIFGESRLPGTDSAPAHGRRDAQGDGSTRRYGVHTRFVTKALREYVSLPVRVEEDDTVFAVRDRVEAQIHRRGRENIYRIILEGQRDPSINIDTTLIERCGMVLSVEDRTVPSFHIEELKERCKGQLIGRFIESFEGHERSMTEEKALQYGLEALLNASRD